VSTKNEAALSAGKANGGQQPKRRFRIAVETSFHNSNAAGRFDAKRLNGNEGGFVMAD